jgi:hypothetical protein
MTFGIDLTLHQLQSRTDSPERAKEYGQLGYMQWLGSLPADACYRTAAMRAYATAKPIMRTDPAVAVFCKLLIDSIGNPLAPLDLALPKPRRRGGARKRRLSL